MSPPPAPLQELVRLAMERSADLLTLLEAIAERDAGEAKLLARALHPAIDEAAGR